MADADKIIAVIQPKYSLNPQDISKKLREEGVSEAIEEAKSNPLWEHSMIYDSSAEQLEPIYFWILDFMADLGFDIEKLVDNFVASPGSGYFAELGARATKMQEEGMKILGSVNIVIKSIINLIYDLKEFEVRLKQYELANSKNPKEKEPGMLGLKQIWMDKVDAQKGYGSINAMSRAEIGFVTLRDSFMIVQKPEDVDRLDLNDRVKRVLKPRVAEFLEWKERSESELKKRFEIEKSYLKSQVNALKLYTRWSKPYLKATEQLMMKDSSMKQASLVSAFDTVVLELSLFGKKQIKIKDEVDAKILPKAFRDLKLKRDYNACVFISFTFRGIPSRVQHGGYTFGGRVEVKFKAFALNAEELKLFAKEQEKEDFNDALKLVELTTEESLKQITDDIDHFMGFTEKKEEKKKKGFGMFFFGESKKENKEKKKKKQEPEIGKIKKDNFEESIIRAFAEQQAAALCFKIYDVYKKSHGMASFIEPEWEQGKWRSK